MVETMFISSNSPIVTSNKQIIRRAKKINIISDVFMVLIWFVVGLDGDCENAEEEKPKRRND